MANFRNTNYVVHLNLDAAHKTYMSTSAKNLLSSFILQVQIYFRRQKKIEFSGSDVH